MTQMTYLFFISEPNIQDAKLSLRLVAQFD